MFRSIITPALAALFLILAVSGSALFFHLKSGWFRELHEWIGLTFAVVALVHAYLNRKTIFAYFKKPVPVAVVAIVLVIGITFGMATAQSSRSRGQQVIDKANEISSSIFGD